MADQAAVAERMAAAVEQARQDRDSPEVLQEQAALQAAPEAALVEQQPA